MSLEQLTIFSSTLFLVSSIFGNALVGNNSTVQCNFHFGKNSLGIFGFQHFEAHFGKLINLSHFNILMSFWAPWPR